MTTTPSLLAVCLAFLLTVPAGAADRPAVRPGAIYADVTGVTVLENARVIVQRFMLSPGRSTGRHVYGAHQFVVFVKGGVLTSTATGRSVLWPDGRVVWPEPSTDDLEGTNAGRAPIDMLWITVKPVRAKSDAARGGQPRHGYLSYPLIAGEDLLDNDDVIIQRFKMNPGAWEGIHAHNPNTFYIFIKGGHWLSKSKEHPEGVPGSAADGTVAWMDAIDIGDQHQSGNVGDTSSEVVWIALKK